MTHESDTAMARFAELTAQRDALLAAAPRLLRERDESRAESKRLKARCNELLGFVRLVAAGNTEQAALERIAAGLNGFGV